MITSLLTTRSDARAISQFRGKIFPARCFNQFAHPTNAADERLVPFLKINLRALGFVRTAAQKHDERQYRPGMAIRFHQGKADFENDETVSVVAVENDALKVQRADGTESRFPLGAGATYFDVGEKRALNVAAGDKLLLQSNWRKHFVNGELVEVKAIQGDSILLADGRVVPSEHRTFTHGYAITSHAAQGKTVDEVLVVASSRSMPAVSQEQKKQSGSLGSDRKSVV